MKPILRQITASRAAIYFLFLIVRVYLLTIRVSIKNEDAWMNTVHGGKPVLLCAFHQQFFFMVRFFRKYFIPFKAGVIISQSRDGEIGAQVAGFSGINAFRGSSSKGGKQAMEEMISFLSTTDKAFGINLVDGPQGPIGKVKPGSIRIIQRTGACLVPVYFTPDRFWQLDSWDQYIIPKPFSKVILTFDDGVEVESGLSDQEFESHRKLLEKTMAPYLIYTYKQES